MAPFQRDPLSVRYDTHARRIIGEAIAAHARHGRPRWVRAALELRHGMAEDAGGRTRDERALQRALYHDGRIHKPGPRRAGGPWSLQIDWTSRAGLISALRVRVLKDTSGARHARRAGGSYVRDPSLRSGPAGSVTERFPS